LLIRISERADLSAVTHLMTLLWAAPEHEAHAAAILAGTPESSMSVVLFVAQIGGDVVAFIEVGMRSHADGCDMKTPVGFVEGWYVEEPLQRRGIGGALMKAAEDWARSHGAREIASDTWIDHAVSENAHVALGFEIVDRCVHFRKSL
jgi:aminoglycoside 6'-N-acetyltransferase I